MCKITDYQQNMILLAQAEQELATANAAYFASDKQKGHTHLAACKVRLRTLEARTAATFAKLQHIALTEARLWKAGEGERWLDSDGVYHYGYPGSFMWQEGEYQQYAELCNEMSFHPTVGEPKRTMLGEMRDEQSQDLDFRSSSDDSLVSGAVQQTSVSASPDPCASTTGTDESGRASGSSAGIRAGATGAGNSQPGFEF